MILWDVHREITKRCAKGFFLWPDYDHYSFAQIPGVVRALLGGDDAHPLARSIVGAVGRTRQVVLLLIDGFGFQQWSRYALSYEFLHRVSERGIVVPLTAVFPSTTSASITTISTGRTPQEHGLIEWRLYLDELDEVILTLPFTPVGVNGHDTLLARGVDPRILYSGGTVYEALAATGVACFIVKRDVYARGAYSNLVNGGATVIPFISASDMVVNLREQLAASRGPAYYFVYWDEVDSMSHEYEPHSPQYQAEVSALTHLLETEFLNRADRRAAEETVLLVTADHGHVRMRPAETVYLNDFPDVMDALAVSPAGRTIHPWGSPRDVFLRVQEDKRGAIVAYLKQALAGKAEVVRSEEVAAQGLFGRGPRHTSFDRRIGNVLILPYEEHTVWYQYPGQERSKKRGMHGGLSHEEMLVPLAAARLGDLLS